MRELIDHFNQHFFFCKIRRLRLSIVNALLWTNIETTHESKRSIIEDCQGTNSPQEWQIYRAKCNEVKVRLREAILREHGQ